MRALLAALVLFVCLFPSAARADIAPPEDSGCGCASAMGADALALAGSLSLLYFVGERRRRRQHPE